MDLGPPARRTARGRPTRRRRRRGSSRCPTSLVSADRADPAEVVAGARDDPPGLRRRAPAPAGPSTSGADPARGAALEGRRRSPSCSTRAWRRSTARSSAPGRRWPRATSGRSGRCAVDASQQSSSPGTSTPSSATTSTRSPRCSTKTPPVDAAVRHVALWPRRRPAWWFGPGIGCQGSRLIPIGRQRLARFRSVRAERVGAATTPWALQVLEIADGKIVEFTFFLSTDRLFPLFGLPPRLDS